MAASEATGPYRVGERIGTSVWKGQDTRNGKPVALKILTKQLPKDQAKRDSIIRDIRVAAALYHNFLVPILEIVPLGDNLVLVMSQLEVLSLSKYINNKPLSRQDFFRLAYQLVDGLKYLHTKGMVHANINGDSVMVTPDAQIKIGGINMMNLQTKAGGISAAYQQKSADPRSVAYMAPEQITNNPVEPRTDIYSTGVVLYEMGTGRLPYDANNAADFARKIVEGQPLSPLTANPSMDKTVLAILGKCLYKDQFRRAKDAKALLEDVVKADPEAEKYVRELVTRTSTVTSAAHAQDASAKQAILFVADVANYDQLAKMNAQAASQATGRMQQLLGESVYLFDGKVLDSFAKQMVAEMPSVENALEAARKGEFDFSPDQNIEGIQVRLLLHYGAINPNDTTKITGEGAKRALEVLQHIPPLQLFLTEEFVKKAGKAVRVRDAGARGGVKLYSIMPSEQPKPRVIEPTTAELEAAAAEEAEEEMRAIAADARKRRTRLIGLGAAALIALLVIGGGAMMLRRKSSAPAQSTPVVASPSSRNSPQLARVFINPIAVEGTDPALSQRANQIRLGALEILRHVNGVQIADSAGPDVTPVAATLRTSTAGPEIVAQNPPGAAPVPAPDAASGIHAVLNWVSTQSKVQVSGVTQSPEALNAYADAVAQIAANDPKAAAALKAAVTADPKFLPAQLLAMRYFSTHDKPEDAVAAAKQTMMLDPSNLDAARLVARTTLALGDVQSAFGAYAVILHSNAGDAEALTHIAKYALSTGDTQKFNAARARMSRVPVGAIPVHDGDELAAAGRFQPAIDKYFTVEERVPNNPALALKIGRFSVLNHSIPIAELELKKLEQSDPTYGYHLLKAYMAAHQRDAAQVEHELASASRASTPGDDFWTSTAEINVLLGQNDKVFDALEKAVARKEPTASYILSDPLFGYLVNDERFQKIRQAAAQEQQDIRSALAQVVI